ncbi:hypothetical protein [uncultured Spirosoma sp.]|uniref:hypothetical protein n=1 Tax=uncultured Spirosoma sp. TaxID=278208 RepID=UPI0025856158|nr:hypothetical protein [uncultured Spirosoma sp.]
MKKYILLLFMIVVSVGNSQAQTLTGCALRGIVDGQWTVYASSGNPDIDGATGEELSFLSQSFLVRPAFFYYDDDDGMNAFSTTQQLAGSQSQFGTICFGLNLLKEQFSLSEGGTNVPIILAHEFAHTVARRYKLNLPTKQNELFADYLAGGYMFYRNRNFKRTDLEAAFRAFYNMGDNDFTDTNHHGTPQSRNACIKQGYIDCLRAMQQGRVFTLDEGVRMGVAFVTSHDFD